MQCAQWENFFWKIYMELGGMLETFEAIVESSHRLMPPSISNSIMLKAFVMPKLKFQEKTQKIFLKNEENFEIKNPKSQNTLIISKTFAGRA